MLHGRFELKFPITAQQKEDFLGAARYGLREDPHGRNAIYRVSSQYFDTSDFLAYWEKLDGEAVRKKFRLRYYSVDDTSEPRVTWAFMEIKHRINQTVYKERVRLSDEGAEAILSDPGQLVHLADHVAPSDRHQRSTIEAVVRAGSTPGFSSVNVISYLREAWIGRLDRRLRVTFDSSCRVHQPSAYLDVSTGDGWPILKENMFVMEIKFDHAVPRWIRDILAHQGAVLQRFSKYAAGVTAPGLGTGLAAARVDARFKRSTGFLA